MKPSSSEQDHEPSPAAHGLASPDRREILLAGAAALALLPFACAPSVRRPSYLRCERPPTPAGAMAVDEVAARILSYAALAPNGHNTQPWRVRVSEPRRWLLMADLARRLPAVDPTDRELRLSLGAFLENLSLAAASLGLAVTVDGAVAWPAVAELHLTPGPVSDYPLARLELRRTYRNSLLPQPIDRPAVQTLLAAAGDALFFPRAASQGKLLAETTVEANRHQTWRNDAQQELARWIRFSDAEVEAACDGLSPATMELTGIGGWYVRHFMDASDVNGRRFRQGGIEATERQVNACAGFMIISSRGGSTAELLETGRRFERMALLARELGIGIHPMTQILEESPWRERIASELHLTDTPQFILRLGRIDSPLPPVSRRRPWQEFVERGDSAG